MDVVVKRHKINSENVDEQLNDLDDYRHAITSHQSITGISIPTTFAHEVRGGDVYFVDQSSGAADMSKMLQDESLGLDTRQALAAGLFGALSRIPRDEHHQTSFMIDGKFSNFCTQKDGTFAYIDLFPAHIRDGNSHLLKPTADHDSGKRSLYTDSFITGDTYGILGRFLGTLRKYHKDIWLSATSKQGHMQSAIDNLPEDLRGYCIYLLENDASFVQTLYGFGAKDPKNSQLDRVLNPHMYQS